MNKHPYPNKWIYLYEPKIKFVMRNPALGISKSRVFVCITMFATRMRILQGLRKSRLRQSNMNAFWAMRNIFFKLFFWFLSNSIDNYTIDIPFRFCFTDFNFALQMDFFLSSNIFTLFKIKQFSVKLSTSLNGFFM